MIAASDWGLGWVIFDSREFLNVDVMLASVAVIGILGFALTEAVALFALLIAFHSAGLALTGMAVGPDAAQLVPDWAMLALLAGHVAASSAISDAAVEASVDGADFFAVAAAKSRVGEAAGKSAEIAHQTHGAMGFTHEHNLHHSTRRLWAWREEFGNESNWQVRLGEMVAREGADALWPLLSAL